MADDAAAPEGELSEGSSQTEVDEVAAEAETDGADSPEDEAVEADSSDAPAAAKRRMSHVRLATIIGLVVVVALAGLCGWLGFRAYESRQTANQRNLFLQVGRQGALNLTTIDFEHVDQDVQRVLDSSTGTFYDDFDARAQPFKEVVKQAKSKSAGTIAEAGVQSMSNDGADVLVAVTVKTSNAGAAEQEPRAWRMLISVQKVGDQAKVSNVRFVS
jgi:Mce-associated membrane protein